jgi:prepilin signal peptidase PulO-like enzyme (type II secretory pathway)
LALIDFDRRVVPIALTLPLGLAGWVAQVWLDWTSPWYAMATSVLAFLTVLGLSEGWTWFCGRGGVVADGPGLGLGDAYALFLVGAFFGPEPTLRIVVWATLAAIVVFLASWLGTSVLRWAGRRVVPVDRLPLVTLLALAALWVLFLEPAGLSASEGVGIMGGR